MKARNRNNRIKADRSEEAGSPRLKFLHPLMPKLTLGYKESRLIFF